MDSPNVSQLKQMIRIHGMEKVLSESEHEDLTQSSILSPKSRKTKGVQDARAAERETALSPRDNGEHNTERNENADAETETEGHENCSQDSDASRASLHFDPAVVCALLRVFFRDIPEPIVPPHQQKDFLFVHEIKDKKLRSMTYHTLIHSLPPPQRRTFVRLLDFLHRAACDVKTYGTSPLDLARIFAPLVFREPIAQQAAGSDTITQETSPQAVDVLKTLIKHYPYIVEVPSNIEYVNKEGQMWVKAASVERLVDLLTNAYYNERDFIDWFLLTYSYFVTALELLTLLMQHWDIGSKEPNSRWRTTVRKRVLFILQVWGVNYYKYNIHDPTSDMKFAKAVLRFLKRIQATLEEEEESIVQCLEVFFQQHEAHLVQQQGSKHEPPATSPRPHGAAGRGFLSRHPSFYHLQQSHFKLYNKSVRKAAKARGVGMRLLGNKVEVVHPLTVAKEMTLIDFELFVNIPPAEMVNKAYQKREEAPHYANCIDRFNTWSSWVVDEIVSAPTSDQRAGIIASFINISQACIALRNYNTAFAIVAGLNSASVSRLKSSWDKLSKKSWKRFSRLQEIAEPKNNYRAYRELVRIPVYPCLPFLAIYGKDMFAVEEGNDDFCMATPLSPRSSETTMNRTRNWRGSWIGGNVIRPRSRSNTKEVPDIPIPKLPIVPQEQIDTSCEPNAETLTSPREAPQQETWQVNPSRDTIEHTKPKRKLSSPLKFAWAPAPPSPRLLLSPRATQTSPPLPVDEEECQSTDQPEDIPLAALLSRAAESDTQEAGDQSGKTTYKNATTPRGNHSYSPKTTTTKKKKKSKWKTFEGKENKLINAEKMRLIWKIVNEIRTYQQQSRYDAYFQELRIEERKTVKRATKKGARSPRLTLEAMHEPAPGSVAEQSNNRLLIPPGESTDHQAPADLHAFLMELAPCMNEDKLYELSLQREPKRV